MNDKKIVIKSEIVFDTLTDNEKKIYDSGWNTEWGVGVMAGIVCALFFILIIVIFATR